MIAIVLRTDAPRMLQHLGKLDDSPEAPHFDAVKTHLCQDNPSIFVASTANFIHSVWVYRRSKVCLGNYLAGDTCESDFDCASQRCARNTCEGLSLGETCWSIDEGI